jgi:hypothetical protein
MQLLLILFLICGLVLIGLAIPLLFNKIPPNPFYGFRIGPAFDSPEIWYAVNHYAARWLIGSGLSLILSAGALYFVPGISLDFYSLSCLVVFGVVFGYGMVKSYRYMLLIYRQNDHESVN